MTAVKKLALSVCVLGISSTSVQAGPMSRLGTSWRWTTWVSNRSTPDNGANTINGPSLNVFSNPSPVAQATPVASAAPSGLTGLTLVASNAPAPIPVAPPQPSYTPPISNSVAYSAADAAPAMKFSTLAAPAMPSAAPVDAYIDLDGGPYPNAGVLTTGGAQPWYNSPTAVQAFGGIPDAQEQLSFSQSVLARVQQTFQLSGLNPTLTLDPNVPALHTLSVVSNTANATEPNAIGMTEVGGSGFGYIDKLAPLNLNADQLAWAVAHNVSHELMHSFGIGTHPDQTGNFLDSAAATSSVLTDPSTTFSPAAVQLMKQSDYGTDANGGVVGAENLTMSPNHVGPKCHCIFCQGLYGGANGTVGAQALEAPVPEPSTILVWGGSLAAAGFMVRRRRKVLGAA